jgi:phosphatidyl-myo-inositol dimannoside synthase
MKILLLTHEYPPYPGGVGRYCASLAAAAARAGHRVTVLAPDHGQRAVDDTPNVNVIRFPGDVFHMRELKAFRGHAQQALKAEPDGFDIVHAADWPAIMALRTLDTGAARRVATLHGSDVLLLKNSWRARLNFSRAALGRFDALLCNSAYTHSLLAQHFPRLATKGAVTPLGVDVHWFEAPEPASITSFRDRIGFRPDEQIVLTVARLDARKGQRATLLALGQLTSELKKQVHYVCVGKEVDPGYGALLTDEATRQGIRLTLTGRIPDAELKAAYGTADLFALTGVEAPGKVEGFGLVLLEAAAQGLPALVTRIQAMPEVVDHGRTGWVSHANELSAAFHQALFGVDKTGLRQACREHAAAYTWDRCATQSYGDPLQTRSEVAA